MTDANDGRKMSRGDFFGLGVAGIAAALLLSSGCGGEDEDDGDDD